MADEKITIDGEQYISSGRAAKLVGYTKDYVGQLARLGKIKATRVGRNWYINEASINRHKVSVHYTLTKPKKRQSEKDEKEDTTNEKASKNKEISPTAKHEILRHEQKSEPANASDDGTVLFPKIQKPKRDPLLDSDIRYEEHKVTQAKKHDGTLATKPMHTHGTVDIAVNSKKNNRPQVQDIRPRTTTRINTRDKQTAKAINGINTNTAIDGIVISKVPQHVIHQRENISHTRDKDRLVVSKNTKPTTSERYSEEDFEQPLEDTPENSKVFPVVGAIIIFTVVTVIYILFFMK